VLGTVERKVDSTSWILTSRAILRIARRRVILASVHIPVLEAATGVVGLDGEAHFDVICWIWLRKLYVYYIVVWKFDIGSGVCWERKKNLFFRIIYIFICLLIRSLIIRRVSIECQITSLQLIASKIKSKSGST
jgi:hypothetical protein